MGIYQRFGREVITDESRDLNLTDFGKDTLSDRYLAAGESFQELFARVACKYSDGSEHAQRLYDAMSKLWFMPATPILSNGGKEKGLPISCFLNAVEDSIVGIQDAWKEHVFLAANGGGIGTYWGDVRSIGESIAGCGKTSGVIPFMKVSDSLTSAVSQGSLRRGSAAVYLDICHPEVEEFIKIRIPSGDFHRKCLNIHHGVNVPDAFMEAVCADVPYPLKSPKDGSVKGEVSARAIFADILDVRMQTGEPYLNFIDTVNRYLPQYQKDLGLQVKTSNLCTEISLVTGRDIYGKQRTAVCCLSSINAEKWDEYKDSFLDLMKDVLRFLDLVLQDYIETASPEQANAVYSAMRERAVGLGVMGFHSYLQSKNIPFESAMAKSFNKMLFTKMRAYADLISKEMAIKYGACPDAADGGVLERFSHKLAIAPTASISIIAGGCSPCVEPWIANVFIQKTLSGSMVVKNKYLQRLLESKGLSPEDIEDVWLSVLDKNGSVQHLDILDEYEKGVYKTAFEIDSVWVLEFAADRAKSVCQAQSINLFLSPSIHKRDLLLLHIRAWQMGIKSLYYLRSLAISRAGIVGSGSVSEDNTLEKSKVHVNVIPVVDPLRKYETCVACE